MDLSERKEFILSSIIERYISTGEPVGSKYLAAIFPFSVSSATIRNEMAYLFENGFLEQPHTSAGRVPSDKGYRYYIEKLLMNYTPSQADMFRVMSSIDHSEGDSDRVLSQGAEILSNLTGCVGIASTPQSENAVIKSVQTVPVSAKRVMVVVATSSGALKSRVAQLSKDVDYEIIDLFYKLSAANFIGVPVSEINRAKLQTAAFSLGSLSLDIAPILASFFDAVSDAAKTGVIVKGHSKLFVSPELHSDAVDITELLGNSDALSVLFGNSADNDVELSIGGENFYSCFRHAAVVKASYKAGETGGGVLAVIGPTKMDYARIIPLVKYVSGAIGSLLTQAIEN